MFRKKAVIGAFLLAVAVLHTVSISPSEGADNSPLVTTGDAEHRQTPRLAPHEKLTLKRCIEIALENQPAILAAINATRAGANKVGEAKSNYYPQVGLSATVSQASTIPMPITFNSQFNYTMYMLTATLNQNIYDFGKTSSLVNVQKLALDAATADLDTSRALVVLQAKLAYFSYLQAIRNKEIADETVRQLERHLDQARGFFDSGIRPKYDVLKAESDLGGAKVSLIRAVNNVRLARLNLDNSMGVNNNGDYTVEDELSYVKFDISPQDALSKAFKSRPDMVAAQTKTRQAEESVKVARTGHYPSISGSASYSWGNTTFPLNQGWNIGATLTVPVFSGYNVSNQIQEAEANLGAVSANEELLRQNITFEVNQSFSNLKASEEAIPASELAVRQARENLDIATGRYDVGVGNPVEVADAQLAFSNAEIAYIQSLLDYKTAQAALEKAIGEIQ